jgi:hypothetical protein
MQEVAWAVLHQARLEEENGIIMNLCNLPFPPQTLTQGGCLC